MSISIIALLIGMLIPALGEARKMAQRIQCLSRVRQVNLGTQLFVVDHKQQMPWTNWDGGDAAAWPETGWLYDASVPEADRSVSDGEINAYLDVDEPYLCPLDAELVDELPGVRRLSSYVMNGAVSGFDRQEPFEIDAFDGSDILFWELDETNSGGSWNDGANRPNELITARHQDGGSIARFDGSGDFENFFTWGELQSEFPGPLWCNPASEDGT